MHAVEQPGAKCLEYSGGHPVFGGHSPNEWPAFGKIFTMKSLCPQLAREQVGDIEADIRKSKRMVLRRWARRWNNGRVHCFLRSQL